MIDNIISSRRTLMPAAGYHLDIRKETAEGGCGVIGMASTEQIAGQHLLQSLIQMRNRGNGKGGGIAVVGLVPEEFGVSREVLAGDYLLAVAYLDPVARAEVEEAYVHPTFIIDHVREQPHIPDYRSFQDLDVAPPKVVQYFVRVKPDISTSFRKEHQLEGYNQQQVEDEIVYQNTFRLNSAFYAAMGKTRAFVLSHGKNMLVLKIVGYGDDVVRYYQLEEMHANVWIGHHRYPTKGRVWHPGGAHPFIGLNEALVHNGDFANYSSVCEYLSQRNIHPLFLTDTEVSVQMFDLLHRTYGYPLEYVIEALAPTTERDFTQLPEEKQSIYKMLQATHIHGSPDGPWFFLIAQSIPGGPDSQSFNLIGITDTSMLRPQVFALQRTGTDGPAIGLAASEKQGIDAALESLASVDGRFWSRADKYWNARGGSHTDGGAFVFSVTNREQKETLVCRDKFGNQVDVDISNPPNYHSRNCRDDISQITIPPGSTDSLYRWFVESLENWNYVDLRMHLETLIQIHPTNAFEVLTRLIDHRYPTGSLRRSSVLSLYDEALNRLVAEIAEGSKMGFRVVSVDKPINSHPESQLETDNTLVFDAKSYPIEGPDSLTRTLVSMYKLGFRKFILTNIRGHRFIGCGFGPDMSGLRIDVYGSSGDYLASGIDGGEIHVHNSAQDQLCQIMKAGKVVIHGDVGQSFGYAAKGGQVYILGNAAGRPMINAVGSPKIIINGTCLDYLAESFMAGDPLNGGGFVIVNGLQETDQGEILDLETPYPGGNLFSLASGGAIYIRDPQKKLGSDQLNGGEITPFQGVDWQTILPFLEENERLFGIPVKRLLEGKNPGQVYRKITPKTLRALQAEEMWVRSET